MTAMTTEHEPTVRTDSPVLAERVAARRAQGARALREAIKKALGTPEGRRVWLWVLLEVCRLEKSAPEGRGSERWLGRRDVAADLGRALVEFPEIRIALAKDRAAADVDDAVYQAELQHLKEITK